MELFWIFISGVIAVLLVTDIAFLLIVLDYFMRLEKQEGGDNHDDN